MKTKYNYLNKQEWMEGISFGVSIDNRSSQSNIDIPKEPKSEPIPITSIPTQRAVDRDVQLLATFYNKNVRLFGDLLSHEECDQLIEMSRPKLQPSTVVNPVNGNYDFDPTRSSQGCFLQRGENDLVRRIENRIGALLGVPVSRGEAISILNYNPGEEYRPHWDYFDPKNPGNKQSLSRGGQRYATLIMYLNDVEAGGSTVFPELGLDVLPRKGSAVYFSYADAQGNLDALSLHGGSPVLAGEKWIATKWLRLYDF